MSLAVAAKHLAKKGRNGDSMLVHMTPREVAGLAALARANGQELTINPETGLPEAFNLKSLLPMIAGAALTATGIGAPLGAALLGSGASAAAAGALGSSLIVGGGTALATGSLEKGLTAGLGAYGGAGLASSVMSAGTGALQAGATSAANSGNLAGIAGTGADAATMTANAAPNAFGVTTSPVSMSMPTATPLAPSGAPAWTTPDYGLTASAPTDAVNYSLTNSAPASTGNGLSFDATGGLNLRADSINRLQAQPFETGQMPQMPQAAEVIDKSIYPKAQTFQAGLKSIGQDPSQMMTMDNAKYAMAAAAPGLLGAEAQQQDDGKIDNSPNPYQYTYTPGRTYEPVSRTSTEATHFRPKYTRMAEGGAATSAAPASGDAPGMGQSERAYAYLFGDSRTSREAPVEAPRLAAARSGLSALAPSRKSSLKDLGGFGLFNILRYVVDGVGQRAAPAPRYTYDQGTHTFQKMAEGGAVRYTYDPKTQRYTEVRPEPAPQTKGVGDKGGFFDPSTYRFVSSDGPSGDAPAKGPGWGPDSTAKVGLGLMALSENPVATVVSPTASYAAGVAGRAAADSAINSYSDGFATMSNPGVAGIGTFADAYGNVNSFSNDATIAAADAAMFGDSPFAGAGPSSDSGGGGGFSDAGGLGAAAAADGAEGGYLAKGGLLALAQGGIGHLGSYSDGGRLLRGPGNGTSDSIPATIGDRRPARLADGEFVIPSRIVSELGNGSTEAGARQLYAMMDRIQKARKKTVGKGKVAVDAKARHQLPA